jgi:hypothetical protein
VALPDDTARIARMYALAFSRPPTEEEVQLARQFLAARPTPERWVQLAQALLMSNEFVYID